MLETIKEKLSINKNKDVTLEEIESEVQAIILNKNKSSLFFISHCVKDKRDVSTICDILQNNKNIKAKDNLLHYSYFVQKLKEFNTDDFSKEVIKATDLESKFIETDYSMLKIVKRISQNNKDKIKKNIEETLCFEHLLNALGINFIGCDISITPTKINEKNHLLFQTIIDIINPNIIKNLLLLCPSLQIEQSDIKTHNAEYTKDTIADLLDNVYEEVDELKTYQPSTKSESLYDDFEIPEDDIGSDLKDMEINNDNSSSPNNVPISEEMQESIKAIKLFSEDTNSEVGANEHPDKQKILNVFDDKEEKESQTDCDNTEDTTADFYDDIYEEVDGLEAYQPSTTPLIENSSKDSNSENLYNNFDNFDKEQENESEKSKNENIDSENDNTREKDSQNIEYNTTEIQEQPQTLKKQNDYNDQQNDDERNMANEKEDMSIQDKLEKFKEDDEKKRKFSENAHAFFEDIKN